MDRLGKLLAFAISLTTLAVSAQPASLSALSQSFAPLQYGQLTQADELTALTKLAKGKSIVAVSEVTHGTKQVGQLQTKLAKDLCQYSGFNVVVLGEVYATSTLLLNQYVCFGQGTIDEALGPIATSQNVVSPELRDLAEWLKNENEKRPPEQRIWLVGTEVAPPRLLADANARWVSQADTQALDNSWFEHVLSQQNYALNIHQNDKQSFREDGIFESIQWLKTHVPAAKIVVIAAHNAHMERVPCYNSDIAPFRTIKRVGHFLHQTYPDDYLVIGTEIAGGRYHSGADNQYNPMPSHPRKLGTLLGQLTTSDYGLLTTQPCRKHPELTGASVRMSYGTSFQKVGSVAKCTNVFDAFDAILFIRESQPTDLLTDFAPVAKIAVYVTLNPGVMKSILAGDSLTVSISDATTDSLSTSKHPVAYVQLYTHDRRKKPVLYQTFTIPTGTSMVQVRLPATTQTVSLWINAVGVTSLKVGRVVVNGHVIQKDEFLLVQPNDSGQKWVMETGIDDGFRVSAR